MKIGFAVSKNFLFSLFSPYKAYKKRFFFDRQYLNIVTMCAFQDGMLRHWSVTPVGVCTIHSVSISVWLDSDVRRFDSCECGSARRDATRRYTTRRHARLYHVSVLRNTIHTEHHSFSFTNDNSHKNIQTRISTLSCSDI